MEMGQWRSVERGGNNVFVFVSTSLRTEDVKLLLGGMIVRLMAERREEKKTPAPLHWKLAGMGGLEKLAASQSGKDNRLTARGEALVFVGEARLGRISHAQRFNFFFLSCRRRGRQW